MADMMVTGLVIAGVLALIAVPVMGMALVRATREASGLAERNAAQAVTIAALERRIEWMSQPVTPIVERPATWQEHERWRAGEGDATRARFDAESG